MKALLNFFYFLIINGALIGCISKVNYNKAEKFIRLSENQWAESTANGDTAIVERILADDFIGISSNGSRYYKKDAIAETINFSKTFIYNHLDSVKIRFFGNMAIAQGTESWQRKSGTILKGKFIWTDAWCFRNNKWQIIAAQDNTIKAE